MKKVILLLFVIIFSFAGFTISVQCQPMEFYVGVKSGWVEVSRWMLIRSELYWLSWEKDIEGISDTYPTGILLGFKKFGFTFEGEFNYGLYGGDWEPEGIEGGMNMWTVAIYTIASISMGDVVYLKAKTGYLYENVSVTIDGETDIMDDTGFSFGGGVGIKITDKVRAEAEFTVIEQDVNFISIGVNYSL